MSIRTFAAMIAVTGALTLVASTNQQALGQGFVPPGAGPGPYGSGAPGQMMNANGDPAVMPVQYCQSCPGGAGGYGGYGEMGAEPYTNVYAGVEQCGPHYFDAAFEFVSLSRDALGGGGVNFTTLNFAADPADDNIVLASGQINGGSEPGFRVTGRYDIGPLSVIEAAYTGLYDMGGSAGFDDPSPSGFEGNLFSPFTDFGRDPSGGFDEDDLNRFSPFDRATSHNISFNSDLQSAELSLRRYWVGHSPRVTGTLLYGFRYTKLKEGFNLGATGPLYTAGATSTLNEIPIGARTASYKVDADNNLAGFQFGGDLWYTALQGLRLGTEGKMGIYNNHYSVAAITADSLTGGTRSGFKKDQVAFIGELRASVVADVLPSVSLKAGYELLYMSSLVTALGNVNTEAPAALAQAVDQGHAFFYGFHTGIEYIW